MLVVSQSIRLFQRSLCKRSGLKLPPLALIITSGKRTRAMADAQHLITDPSKSPPLIELSRHFDVDNARHLALKTFEASIDLFYPYLKTLIVFYHAKVADAQAEALLVTVVPLLDSQKPEEHHLRDV